MLGNDGLADYETTVKALIKGAASRTASRRCRLLVASAAVVDRALSINRGVGQASGPGMG